jgi:hypothetical protein
MRIGLDYGGVISHDPPLWAKALEKAKELGNDIFIISHAQPGADLQLRKNFAASIGITDLSFDDLKSGSQEMEIATRKADICEYYNIDVFIDDDINRTDAVGRRCSKCVAVYVPQSVWQIGLCLIDGIQKL